MSRFLRGSLLVWIVGAVGVCAASGAGDLGRTVVFADDFSDPEGFEERWSAFSGHWVCVDGVVRQDAGGYDHGMVVRTPALRCDYRIEARVRLVAGGSGAGLYWNVADAETGENGNMLRYDGVRPIMFGWMHGRGFLGTGGATGDLLPDGEWHTVRMDVRNGTGRFDLWWDGERILVDAPMRHRGGHVGLECSMGTAEFDDVLVTVEEGVDPAAAIPWGEASPEWVRSVAKLSDGSLVYPVRSLNRIQRVDIDGRLLAEWGDDGDDALRRPMAVAVGPDEGVYVTDAGNGCVRVFTAEGELQSTLRPDEAGAFDRPFGIAVDDAGRVWVGDAGAHRLVVLSPEGAVEAVIGGPGSEPGQFRDPAHLCMIGGRLFVADRGNRRLQVFDPTAPDAASGVIEIAGNYGPLSVAQASDGCWLVAMERGVTRFDREWNRVGEYAKDVCGDVWAWDVITLDDGRAVIADEWSHRLVVTSETLPAVALRVEDLASDGATVRWNTAQPAPTRLRIAEAENGAPLPMPRASADAATHGDGKERTRHEVRVEGLSPATRYACSIFEPVATIPRSDTMSLPHRFATPAMPGSLAYTRVPVAVVAYGHVTFESQAAPGAEPRAPDLRDEAWFSQVKDAHDAMRWFYWQNSQLGLDVDCRYLLVERPVDFTFLGSSSGEVLRDVDLLAEREGLDATDFGAVIVIGGNCCYAYPWPTPWYGAKLTETTGCCFAGGGDLWLSTHEFHHLTEGWMNMIGFPVGPDGYGHADIPWQHPYSIGENFDFLASTLRKIPRTTYLRLAVGDIVTVVDADADGVPDHAPDVPYDEARSGTRTDTDRSYANGLTDLENLTAGIFRGAVPGHDHARLETEWEARHPFAIFEYDYDRPRGTPEIDGKLAGGEWASFAEVPNAAVPPPPGTVLARTWQLPEDAECTVQTFLEWDDDSLYVAARSPARFLISVQLDADADGYFRGNDNPRVGVQIPRDDAAQPGLQTTPAHVMVWNNVEPVAARGVPDWTNALYDRAEEIRWAWARDEEGWFVIEMAIPRCEAIGLDLEEGEEIGTRLWFQELLPEREGERDRRCAFEIFEPCQYGYFRLAAAVKEEGR